jgi:hypothetical protein
VADREQSGFPAMAPELTAKPIIFRKRLLSRVFSISGRWYIVSSVVNAFREPGWHRNLPPPANRG